MRPWRERVGDDTMVSYPAFMAWQSDLDRLRDWAMRNRYGDSSTAFRKLLDIAEEDERIAEVESTRQEDLHDALNYALMPQDDWVRAIQIAHFHIPRIELETYMDMGKFDETEVVARLMIYKTLTAFAVTTWPGHE